MNSFPHPSHRLDKSDVEQIRKEVIQSEANRELSVQQLDVIYRNNWFKMFMPVKLGGLGLSLPDVLRIEEGLSWADGSTGWVVTLCSGAGWFAGFLNPTIVEEFCTDNLCCLAGSGASTGVAEIEKDGYVVNGKWRYASGSMHATAFTANCLIKENGQQLYNADGSPKVLAFIFKKNEVIVHHTWNGMGMRATGTHSFEIKNVHVPHERIFIIDAAHTFLNDPVYKYPFLQLAEATLAVNISGLACRFIDLWHDFFERTDDDRSTRLLALALESRNNLDQLRSEFFNVVDESWAMLISGNTISPSVLTNVSRVSHNLVRVSRAQINHLYPLCGLRAAMIDSEINRVWRDFHTAAQHALFLK